jgi:putative membrane protein
VTPSVTSDPPLNDPPLNGPQLSDPGLDTELADGNWHRMHPLTPIVRSWRVLIVILVFLVNSWGDNLVSGDGVPDVHRPDVAGRWLAGGGAVLLALILVGIGYAVLSWRATRFRVVGEALELHSGILFRHQRRARLDRIQTVDVVQPFVARLAGLARLTLEVAGGSGSNVSLFYLKEEQARRLRNHLIAAAAGVRYEGPVAPEAPERQTLEVPVGRLIGALILSGPAIVFIVGVLGFLAASIVIANPGAVLGVFPVFFGVVGMLWTRFNGGFGFRVATSPDGLRLRHGLLEQRTQTVPPGRVQAVRLSQSLLWRRPDWWTVRVNIAGYSGGDGSDRQQGEVASMLLPVGSRYDATAVLALVLPDLGVREPENPWTVVAEGLSGSESLSRSEGLAGSDPLTGYLGAPRRARWLDPIGWRRTGVRVTEQALLIRRGVLNRSLDVVPHERTQSLGLTQGPVQRRLGLASFAVHSTSGPVEPVVAHLDARVAAQLLAEQAVRAEAARRAAGPERWMEGPTGSDPAEQPVEGA